jgi:hypothetical protein
MNIRAFFLQLFCGAVGGYIAGVGFSKLSWGALGDSLIGVAGGGGGGQIFEHFWAGDAYCTDMEVFLASTLGGCISGALLLAFAGFMKLIVRR